MSPEEQDGFSLLVLSMYILHTLPCCPSLALVFFLPVEDFAEGVDTGHEVGLQPPAPDHPGQAWWKRAFAEEPGRQVRMDIMTFRVSPLFVQSQLC